MPSRKRRRKTPKTRKGNSMKNESTYRGIGFTGLLTIAFIVLKLCGIISWSWIWVLSPIWISAVLGLSFILIIIIIKFLVNR